MISVVLLRWRKSQGGRTFPQADQSVQVDRVRIVGELVSVEFAEQFDRSARTNLRQFESTVRVGLTTNFAVQRDLNVGQRVEFTDGLLRSDHLAGEGDRRRFERRVQLEVFVRHLNRFEFGKKIHFERRRRIKRKLNERKTSFSSSHRNRFRIRTTR